MTKRLETRSTRGQPEFFEMRAEAEALNSAIFDVVREVQKQLVNQRLSEENNLRYSHGRTWTNRANPNARDGALAAHSVEWETSFQDIVDGDLSQILKFVVHTSHEFHKQFIQMMYSTLTETCNETGNTVDAKGAGSFPAGFMEALKKIEFSVDRQGNVSLPEVHVGADPAKLVAELEAQPPEYHAEMERIKAEKTEAALERERERKQRFRTRANK